MTTLNCVAAHSPDQTPVPTDSAGLISFDPADPMAVWAHQALLDHAALLRHDRTGLVALWQAPDARLLEVDPEGRIDVDPFGRPVSADDGPEPSESTIFVGLLDSVPWFAVRVDHACGTTVRQAVLTAGEREIASSAMAALNWYRRSRHCVLCGGDLVRTLGGFAAVCQRCGAETFPRTDPAIICAVLDHDDRLYLAHQASWEGGRVSVLAGFIEAGESAEQAVWREIAEEASLELETVRYVGSQPWPLPRSLMLSFVARSPGGGHVDGDELSWGQWYSREQLRAGVSTGELALPPGASVGRYLIDSWLKGVLPVPEH